LSRRDYLNKKVEINHTPEIKGGLKALKDKGIRITSDPSILNPSLYISYRLLNLVPYVSIYVSVFLHVIRSIRKVLYQ
jgi:hypothetical protein